MRKRAALLPHSPQPTSQYNLPALGKHSAYQANRAGGAARWPAPAVQQSIEVALTRLEHADRLRRALALAIGPTAKQHHPQPWYRLPAVPGSASFCVWSC